MDLTSRFRLSSPPDETRGRVLVVHASAEMRRRLREALVAANCEVVEASDGTQAYMMVLAMEIDLAIIDLDMKPGSGFEFMHALPILPVDSIRPELIVWSSLVGTPAADEQLRHVRAAAKLTESADLSRLLAAADAVLDDPLQFVQQD